MVFYGREKVLRLRDIQATIYDSKSDYKDLLVQVRKELTALNLTDVRSDICLLYTSMTHGRKRGIPRAAWHRLSAFHAG